MKTQCPGCKQLWNIQEHEQGASMKCFNCTTEFTAAVYTGPIPEVPPPKRSLPSGPRESTGPLCYYGFFWYLLSGAVLFFGIVGGAEAKSMIQERSGLVLGVITVLFFLIAFAIGSILYHIDRIECHIEKLREEVKGKE